jgi:hypothetical protein
MPSWKTLGLAGGTAGRAGDVDVGGTSNRDKGAACAWSRSRSRSGSVKVVTSQATLPTKLQLLVRLPARHFHFGFQSDSSGPSFTLTAAIHSSTALGSGGRHSSPPLLSPCEPVRLFPLAFALDMLHSASFCPALLYSASRALCITVRACGIAFANTVADIFLGGCNSPVDTPLLSHVPCHIPRSKLHFRSSRYANGLSLGSGSGSGSRDTLLGSRIPLP